MLIKEKALAHWIDHFYGYGSWRAPFWFVAYEESGGEVPEEVAAKLVYFYDRHGSNPEPTLCDIRELYRHVSWESIPSNPSTGSPPVSGQPGTGGLYRNLYEFRFGDNARTNTVWKNLIAFRHGSLDQAVPDPLEYQKKVFASSSTAQEAMLRLYPLPRSNHHAWYYSWLDLPQFPFLKSRVLYQEHLFQKRMNVILGKMRECRPRLVLMYGMENINVLKRFIHESFPSAKFKMVKAIKGQIPQHHRADVDGSTVLITTQIPALRHHRVETGFDWYRFGEMVRKGIRV
jgi:hypothetical protein